MKIFKATKGKAVAYFIEYKKEFVLDVLKLHNETIGDYYYDGENLYCIDIDYDTSIDEIYDGKLIPVGTNTTGMLLHFYDITKTFLAEEGFIVEEVDNFK